MDFTLTENQRSMIQHAQDSAPLLMSASPEAGGMPRNAWNTWGLEGWLGTCLPEEHGGGGRSAHDTVIGFEALGFHGVARGQLFSVGAHLFGCAKGIAVFGTDQQRTKWCPKLASGDKVGALAFTEPSGGSNLGDCETIIAQDGDGLILSGKKTHVTNGTDADVFLVLAASEAQPPPFNLTVLLVPRETKGLTVRKIDCAIGLRETAPAEISFTKCSLPTDCVLGSIGGGLGVLIGIMGWERTCILAGLLGALERDITNVTAYLGQTRGLAEPPIRHQSVAHSLARMRLRSETARQMLYRGASELDHGKDRLVRPAMVKLAVSEALVDCAVELLRITAGFGWTGGLGLGQALDDAMGALSASGTSEVQLNMIATGFGRK